MATKKAKPKKAQTSTTAAAQACVKCGCTDLITQLRKVVVDIGWKMTQIHAIAPAKMCTKCGDLKVGVNAVVGDLANLIPDPDAVKRLQKQAADAAKGGKGGRKRKAPRKNKGPKK